MHMLHVATQILRLVLLLITDKRARMFKSLTPFCLLGNRGQNFFLFQFCACASAWTYALKEGFVCLALGFPIKGCGQS